MRLAGAGVRARGSATIDANVAIRKTAVGFQITLGVAEAPVQVRARTSNITRRSCDQPADVKTDETTPEVKGGIEIGVSAQQDSNTPELNGSWSGPAINSIGQVGMLSVTWKLRPAK
jgi:hypothetical protein